MNEDSKTGIVKDKTARSLSEYIKLLKIYSSDTFFFRGENGFYTEREAGAFRNFSKGADGNNNLWTATWSGFTDLINRYYREIAYRLDEVERKAFLAFSQHYGIPTNLVDVSSSPLTALFFACCGNQSDGYIYVFDNAYIDITDLIENKPTFNFIELMAKKDSFAIIEFKKLMKNYADNFPKNFNILYNHLIDNAKRYLENIYTEEDKKLINRLRHKENKVQSNYSLDNLEIAIEINKTEKYLNEFLLDGSDIDVYIILAIYLLSELHSNQECLWWFNWLPTMIYRPNILFERARIQHGFFIVQGYMHHVEETYNTTVLARQRITFQQRIKIENTVEILKELDNIGVNKATIFGDFDNIAKYMVDKYNGVIKV
jgi:hypothetical protein